MKERKVGFWSILLVALESYYLTLSLTIIPRGGMGYWLRDHEGSRNNYFSKIQLVGQKYQEKTTLAS